jgi:TatD DNase family protein
MGQPALVDSHCHLDRLSPRGSDATEVERALAEALDTGVVHLLCVSVNLEDFPRVLRLALDHAQVSASVGVHPNERPPVDPTEEGLAAPAGNRAVVAIGETGLDYHRAPGEPPWQEARFRRHIRAARAVGKPLIIHSREAREDTLAVLREEGADQVGGVMHCFAEDWETARRAMDLNFFISFSGIVTFANAHALRDVARRVPLDRMLVETDAPWLAPAPHRGKPNRPAFVRHVAECVADVRGVSLDVVAQATTENFFTLFPSADAPAD